MITFRSDTSFPFLKIARESGVPYEKVLQLADKIESGGWFKSTDHMLAMILKEAIVVEHHRRLNVQGPSVKCHSLNLS